MTDPKGPEVGVRALFRLVEACEGLADLDFSAGGEDHTDEINRVRALAAAVRLDILDKAPAGLD